MEHTRSKQMQHTLVRLAIGVPAAFNALSAIGGGIALLLGTYQDGVLIETGGKARFPLEWLQQTPFSAAVLDFTGRDEGILASAVARLVMAGFVFVEVVMLRQGISRIECLYCGLGLAISGLATSLWMAGHRCHHLKIKHT
jgi:hypothetical protein